MNKKVLAITLLCVLLAACGISEADVQATIAALPTQTAVATLAPTLAPTDAPPSPTPSPTPDVRVIDVDPQTLLLRRDDLPADARYYLPASGWVSPHRNSEIISGWGVERGAAYLEETGRVDGWVAEYRRGTSTVIAPLGIFSNPVLYRTAAGAMLILTKYGHCAENPFQRLDDPMIGDASAACISREMQPNGENYVELYVAFTYRNAYHSIIAYGYERDVKPEYVYAIAEIALQKMMSAPLSGEVTFTP